MSLYHLFQFHWYIDTLIHLIVYFCWTTFILHIFAEQSLYCTYFSCFFFSNSIIWSSIDLYQIGYFDKGSSDILSLSNVEISPLSTDFVTCISFGLTWLSFRLFKTFCNLQMVIRFSIIWLRYFRFSSSSNGTFIVNSFFYYLGGLILNVPFYPCLCELPFAKYRFRLKESPLLQ